MDRIFILKNDGGLVNNDLVLPGAPYILGDNSYTFKLFPRTPFWRFGIRLSKTPEIEFFHPGSRYKSPEFNKYKDIHLGVGEWDNIQWSAPERLHLAQYNFDGYSNESTQSMPYVREAAITWRIAYDNETGTLDTYISADKGDKFGQRYEMNSEFRYFKIFAWADSMAFEIECQLEIMEPQTSFVDDHYRMSFSSGNILYRLGDMADNDIIIDSDVLLLPAGADGTLSRNIEGWVAELEIPKAETQPAGSIQLFPKKGQWREINIGYAYSVEDQSSSKEIIFKAATELAEFCTINNHIRKVNLPLLGTGAGRLAPATVAEIFDEVFNRSGLHAKFVVSILNSGHLHEVKTQMKGKWEFVTLDDQIRTPTEIVSLEFALSIKVRPENYRVNWNWEVTSLILEDLNTADLDALMYFTSLRRLRLDSCVIQNFNILKKLILIDSLYISECTIDDFGFLASMPLLRGLELSYSGINQIGFLANYNYLIRLNLAGNQIENVDVLSSFSQLEELDISHNKIESIRSLVPCIYLEVLNVSHNQCSKLIDVVVMDKLRFLTCHANPFVQAAELLLRESENHLDAVKNYISRQLEQGKKEISLPVKVLLLGNHAAGKSSLLFYLQEDKLTENISSTHIIKIEKYPQKTRKIPTAIFFDFGGQDYYHGIYRAFLSGGAVYLLCWNAKNNLNRVRKDANGILTQDFALGYWLRQKEYMETEIFGTSDPVLLIQSNADRERRMRHNAKDYHSEIVNEFFVCLSAHDKPWVQKDMNSGLNNEALKFLKASIIDLIVQKKNTKKEPQWYIDFIVFILKQNQRAGFVPEGIDEIARHYRAIGSALKDSLRAELDQLHQRGLILYYKNELPDVAWLNPVRFVKHVHDKILNKKNIGTSNGRTPAAHLDKFNSNIIQLLCLQKVIFRHVYGENGPEYIIPNFLPLASEDGLEYDLHSFGLGNPLFSLKFTQFLPFGLINQLICFFGRMPDKKKFWRDQLLFTFNGSAKILIQLNFMSLEIKVYGMFAKATTQSGKDLTVKYLFYSIVGLYWNFDLLSFEDFAAFVSKKLSKDDFLPEHTSHKQFLQAENLYENEACRPADLFISVDGNAYINYADLCAVTVAVSIDALIMDAAGELSNQHKVIPVISFQPFTNKELRRRKQAVISYSKKDIELVDKFKQYMVPLFDDGLIDIPWYCTELIAGSEWDETIQEKFNQADIIFFMISENLMSTAYVKEHEIKNAIDRWDIDKSIKIIPVILVHYHWARQGVYNLARFTALPYTAKPVTDFSNEHTAWHIISEQTRLMIEREWNPEQTGEVLTEELKKLYERIMAGKLDKNS